MRELKFRAWDWLRKQFVTSPDIVVQFDKFGGMYCVLYDDNGDKAHVPLQQFTGLEDCNGVEIWEGDIVRWDINDTQRVAPIGFEDGAFRMLEDILIPAYGKVYNDWLRGEYTVVGNIYERPELLESGTQRARS